MTSQNLHRPSLTTPFGLRRAKVGFGTDGGFLYILLYKGDVRALFLEKGESRHATALRGARSRFEGPIGSFSMYVCALGDIRALFLEVSV